MSDYVPFKGRPDIGYPWSKLEAFEAQALELARLKGYTQIGWKTIDFLTVGLFAYNLSESEMLIGFPGILTDVDFSTGRYPLDRTMVLPREWIFMDFAERDIRQQLARQSPSLGGAS